MRHRIVLSVALVVAFLFTPRSARAQLPSPEEYLGHRAGADRKLVSWAKIEAYFRRAEATGRVHIQELGASSEGRPMIMAVIGWPETLKELDKQNRAQPQGTFRLLFNAIQAAKRSE